MGLSPDGLAIARSGSQKRFGRASMVHSRDPRFAGIHGSPMTIRRGAEGSVVSAYDLSAPRAYGDRRTAVLGLVLAWSLRGSPGTIDWSFQTTRKKEGPETRDGLRARTAGTSSGCRCAIRASCHRGQGISLRRIRAIPGASIRIASRELPARAMPWPLAVANGPDSRNLIDVSIELT
jgi:hypothetical protein